MDIKAVIEQAWEDRNLLKEKATVDAIDLVIEKLDKGKLRTAEIQNGNWVINEWVKKAVVLYFPSRKMETIEVGPFEFHDKMKLKTNYSDLGVRVVPHAVARYGSYISSGVIMMPSYVNIEYRGFVPDRKVVIPGSYEKDFPAGKYQVPCALIIGERKESTDLKTSLNEALREYDIST